jgi:adenylate kinase
MWALESVSAFLPRKSSTSGWGVSKEASTTTSTLQAQDDDNFEGINLKALLSAKQLKRMSRINKRKANQAARKSASPAPTATKKKSSAKKDPVRIIIAGAPASGKGTQCEFIQEKFGLVHLSTGDMLRAAVAAKTEVGVLAKEYMDSGKLVPDEVIIGVVSLAKNTFSRKNTIAFVSV